MPQDNHARAVTKNDFLVNLHSKAETFIDDLSDGTSQAEKAAYIKYLDTAIAKYVSRYKDKPDNYAGCEDDTAKANFLKTEVYERLLPICKAIHAQPTLQYIVETYYYGILQTQLTSNYQLTSFLGEGDEDQLTPFLQHHERYTSHLLALPRVVADFIEAISEDCGVNFQRERNAEVLAEVLKAINDIHHANGVDINAIYKSLLFVINLTMPELPISSFTLVKMRTLANHVQAITQAQQQSKAAQQTLNNSQQFLLERFGVSHLSPLAVATRAITSPVNKVVNAGLQTQAIASRVSHVVNAGYRKNVLDMAMHVGYLAGKGSQLVEGLTNDSFAITTPMHPHFECAPNPGQALNVINRVRQGLGHSVLGADNDPLNKYLKSKLAKMPEVAEGSTNKRRILFHDKGYCFWRFYKNTNDLALTDDQKRTLFTAYAKEVKDQLDVILTHEDYERFCEYQNRAAVRFNLSGLIAELRRCNAETLLDITFSISTEIFDLEQQAHDRNDGVGKLAIVNELLNLREQLTGDDNEHARAIRIHRLEPVLKRVMLEALQHSLLPILEAALDRRVFENPIQTKLLETLYTEIKSGAYPKNLEIKKLKKLFPEHEKLLGEFDQVADRLIAANLYAQHTNHQELERIRTPYQSDVRSYQAIFTNTLPAICESMDLELKKRIEACREQKKLIADKDLRTVVIAKKNYAKALREVVLTIKDDMRNGVAAKQLAESIVAILYNYSPTEAAHASRQALTDYPRLFKNLANFAISVLPAEGETLTTLVMNQAFEQVLTSINSDKLTKLITAFDTYNTALVASNGIDLNRLKQDPLVEIPSELNASQHILKLLENDLGMNYLTKWNDEFIAELKNFVVTNLLEALPYGKLVRWGIGQFMQSEFVIELVKAALITFTGINEVAVFSDDTVKAICRYAGVDVKHDAYELAYECARAEQGAELDPKAVEAFANLYLEYRSLKAHAHADADQQTLLTALTMTWVSYDVDEKRQALLNRFETINLNPDDLNDLADHVSVQDPITFNIFKQRILNILAYEKELTQSRVQHYRDQLAGVERDYDDEASALRDEVNRALNRVDSQKVNILVDKTLMGTLRISKQAQGLSNDKLYNELLTPLRSQLEQRQRAALVKQLKASESAISKELGIIHEQLNPRGDRRNPFKMLRDEIKLRWVKPWPYGVLRTLYNLYGLVSMSFVWLYAVKFTLLLTAGQATVGAGLAALGLGFSLATPLGIVIAAAVGISLVTRLVVKVGLHIHGKRKRWQALKARTDLTTGKKRRLQAAFVTKTIFQALVTVPVRSIIGDVLFKRLERSGLTMLAKLKGMRQPSRSELETRQNHLLQLQAVYHDVRTHIEKPDVNPLDVQSSLNELKTVNTSTGEVMNDHKVKVEVLRQREAELVESFVQPPQPVIQPEIIEPEMEEPVAEDLSVSQLEFATSQVTHDVGFFAGLSKYVPTMPSYMDPVKWWFGPEDEANDAANPLESSASSDDLPALVNQ